MDHIDMQLAEKACRRHARLNAVRRYATLKRPERRHPSAMEVGVVHQGKREPPASARTGGKLCQRRGDGGGYVLAREEKKRKYGQRGANNGGDEWGHVDGLMPETGKALMGNLLQCG